MRPSLTNAPWVYTRKEKQNAGAASDVAVWTPASGKSIFIHRITVTTSAAATIQVTEGNDASGTRLIDIYAPENGGIDMPFPFEAPFKLAADSVLKITTSAGNSKIVVYGIEA